jgi:hypothetical protein
MGARRRLRAAWKTAGRTLVQRLHAQAGQQLARRRQRLARGPHHGAETARIVQAQHPMVGPHVHVVVHARRRQGRRELQPARHAQVQQQQALVQIHQQVLAAPAHAVDQAPRQGLGRHAQRPAQGLAQHAFDAGARIRSAKLRRVTSTSGNSGMGANKVRAWIIMIRCLTLHPSWSVRRSPWPP